MLNKKNKRCRILAPCFLALLCYLPIYCVVNTDKRKVFAGTAEKFQKKKLSLS